MLEMTNERLAANVRAALGTLFEGIKQLNYRGFTVTVLSKKQNGITGNIFYMADGFNDDYFYAQIQKSTIEKL